MAPKRKEVAIPSLDTQKEPVYLVTGDLRHVLRDWAREKDLILPGKRYFKKLRKNLRKNLRGVFAGSANVVYLPGEDIQARLMQALEQEANGTAVVSLDPVYCPNVDMTFDSTRIMAYSKHNLESPWRFLGYGPRRISDRSIQRQLHALQQQLASEKNTEVVLVDDGIWSWGSLKTLTHCLEERGLTVVKTIVAIQKLSASGEIPPNVISLWQPLSHDRIIDWICERDFFVGVPYSGKVVGEIPTTLQNKALEDWTDLEKLYPAMPMAGNYSAPYIEGLGDSIHWASIPAEKAIEFSRQCLGLSIRLYSEIERLNSKASGGPIKIRLKDLARPPYLWREPEMGVVEALRQIAADL